MKFSTHIGFAWVLLMLDVGESVRGHWFG